MIQLLNFLINKNRLLAYAGLIIITFILTLCNKNKQIKAPNKLFTNLTAKNTGIDFENKIIENDSFYYYKYIYSYIGAGVASADFNNDGRQDLFLVSNTGQNKLYINSGGLKFKDITSSAGILYKDGFNTGVSIVDINCDGFLDIYISRAGWYKDKQKCANLLYINKGGLIFEEQAERFGLADTNRSIQTSFFDYDKDGDLDVYIVNAPVSNKVSGKLIDLNSIKHNAQTKKLGGSDSFYENIGNNSFVNTTEKVGIAPDIAFGLNAQVGDLNNDGWLDIYVNNDFNMPDFAYINNQDGTFTDKRNEFFKHQSFYSMGGDIADINNDGFLDMISLDMSPEDYIRSKTTMAMTSVDKFNTMIKNDYHYQYMHNVLQLNNGGQSFSEIANMAGIAHTDWSWAPLLADFDLDGYNDIYITNGVYRDVIDKDANNHILNLIRKKGSKPTSEEFLEYTQMLPQQKLSNYFFKNNGNLSFSQVSLEWNNPEPSFSNGAVYTDLDNDGDLDIVINNINDKTSILKNNAIETNKGNYIQFQFKGQSKNLFGNGTTVNLYTTDGNKQTRQLINSRGYMSSVSNKLHFGLHSSKNIKKIEIIWSDGKRQELKNIKVNQLIEINYSEAIDLTSHKKASLVDSIFQKKPFNFIHKDSAFNDYNIQILLPHKLSQQGPAIAKSDINNDGLDDVYLGGGYLQPGQLLIGLDSTNFKHTPIRDFIKDKRYEDIDAAFFDLENDGDLDLYVVSGSYEFQKGSIYLQDRIYKNNGNGKYTRCTDCLPEFLTSGSVVKPADFDKDGDIDLFIGGRVIPGKYPYAPKSYLLINDNGNYTIKTTLIAKELENIGMVTDAVWSDIDHDKDLDLILTGEWMGIEFFENKKGKLSRSKKYKTLLQTIGWWNKLLVVDIDNDGDQDIIAGNLGLNYKLHATKDKPFEIYTKDFDKNGSEDIFLAKYYNGKQVPIRGKRCSTQQIPTLSTSIHSYKDFANKELVDVLGTGINSALHYKATEFRSGIFINDANSKFSFLAFDNKLQTAPINSILFEDFDKDGYKDILMAGNNYQAEIETTRADAGIGSFLKGNGKVDFKFLKNSKTRFYADKDIRNLVRLKTSQGKSILVINNNDKHELFSIKK